MFVIEGKTKKITPGVTPGTVSIETKDELTGGDAAKKASIEGIAVHKTTQTVNVFELLKLQGIPVAFLERTGDKTFSSLECEILPLELVMRRYFWGSKLKRNPEFKQKDGTPFRSNEVECEFYHKNAVVIPPNVDETTMMTESTARDRFLRDGVWADGVYTDPYIHRKTDIWDLHPPKVPFKEEQVLISIEPLLSPEDVKQVTALMISCFEVLEKALQGVSTQYGPVALADIKIEIGRNVADGTLILADVIDNDSWRIWPGADPTKQLDKQNFRDGHPLSEISDNYALVAQLTGEMLENA